MPAFLLPAISAGVGALQSIFGHSQEKDAERQLENLQTPTYTPSSSIMDYYNKALQRYNVNPYGSPLYQMTKQNALRSTAMGLSALQNRRQVLGGVQNLVQGQNDALLKAGAVAEQQQGQQLGQLGQAAGAKAGEDTKAFNYNQLAPYQKQYNLLSMKAGAGAGIMNAGLQNIFGGIGAGENMALADKIYGSGGGNNLSQGDIWKYLSGQGAAQRTSTQGIQLPTG